MATRSFISKYNHDTRDYTSIYTHWDGYPEGVGVTLRDHYKTDEKIRHLLNLGDISSLDETVGATEVNSYKTRGDKDDEVAAKTFAFYWDMIEYYRKMGCEYGYVWRGISWECYNLDPVSVDLYALTKETANV